MQSQKEKEDQEFQDKVIEATMKEIEEELAQMRKDKTTVGPDGQEVKLGEKIPGIDQISTEEAQKILDQLEAEDEKFKETVR